MVKKNTPVGRWRGVWDGAAVGGLCALVVGVLFAASAAVAAALGAPFEAREFVLGEIAIIVGLVLGGSIWGLLAGFATSRLTVLAIAACSVAPLLFLGLLFRGFQLRDVLVYTALGAAVFGAGIGWLGVRSLRW